MGKVTPIMEQYQHYLRELQVGRVVATVTEEVAKPPLPDFTQAA